MKKNQLSLLVAVTAGALALGASSSHAAMTINNLGGTSPNTTNGNYFAPTTDIFYAQPLTSTSNSNLSVTNNTNPSYSELGSTFTTPDIVDASKQWGLTAITLTSRADTNYNQTTGQAITLTIYTSTDGFLNDTNGTDTAIYTGHATLPSGANIANYNNFEFALGTTVYLNDNSTYGFLLSFDDNTAGTWQLNTSNGNDYAGQTLVSDGSSITNGAVARDLNFYLKGTEVIAVPEPSAALLGSLGLLALLRRRRA